MIQAVTAVIGRIVPPYGTPDDTDPSGIQAVAQALAESRGLENGEFTATLGEPDIGTLGGEYINRPQIEVPVNDTPAGDGGTLAFNIDEFENLMDLVDITDPHEFIGLEVPIGYANGEVHIRWDDLVDQASDEAAETTDDVQDSESDNSSSVTVTERDVSAASSDSNSDVEADD